MRYYRVKPQYDNYKLSRDYEIFVGTELLTETEYKKALLKYANRNNTRRATIPPSSRDKAMFAENSILSGYIKMIWAIVDIIRAQIAIFTYSFLCCEMLKYSNYRRFYNEH